MVATKAYLDELHDKNKASYKYLSSSHSSFSYTHCPDEIKEEMKGKMATNDLAESSFGAVTNQMQTFTRIDIAGVAVISDLRRNKCLNRDLYLYRPLILFASLKIQFFEQKIIIKASIKP